MRDSYSGSVGFTENLLLFLFYFQLQQFFSFPEREINTHYISYE